jgi:hypothetical protein
LACSSVTELLDTRALQAGMWMLSLLVVSLIPITLFKGKYFRLQEDAIQ